MPTGVRLLPSVEIEQAGFIEIDLASILFESLHLVQSQVQKEMKEHRLFTYAQNKKLKKEIDQL